MTDEPRDSLPDLPARDFQRRPPYWGEAVVTGFSTVQLGSGGLFGGKAFGKTPIHLVRSLTRGGTPGPLLCGLDHHTLPVGFSVGGGTHTPHLLDADPQTTPCPLCVAVAARMMLAAGFLMVSGSVGGDRMRRAVDAELHRMAGVSDETGATS